MDQILIGNVCKIQFYYCEKKLNSFETIFRKKLKQNLEYNISPKNERKDN